MAYRYLGNKSRIVGSIVSRISSKLAMGAIVADPMCGTAAVSSALALAGYSVHAGDELKFPTLHARARVLIKRTPSFRKLGGYRAVLGDLNALAPYQGLFHKEYGASGEPANGSKPRGYFTAENAGKIDAIRRRIISWRDAQSITASEHALLLHDLILAANRVANIAGTYGYYRSSWNAQSMSPLILAPSTFTRTIGHHRVLQGRVEDVADLLQTDACYLDPPYTKRQYGGNYHIPETLAQEDYPDPVGEGGLRDWYPQSSDFCSKRLAGNAFQEVLKRLDCEHIFVSYSEDGQIPSRELLALLNEHGRVERWEFPLNRYRSNSAGRSGTVNEHLYYLKKA